MKRLLIRALALVVMAGAAGAFLTMFKIAYELALRGEYLPTGFAAFSCLIAMITISYMLEVFWSESKKAKEQEKTIAEMKVIMFQAFAALESSGQIMNLIKGSIETSIKAESEKKA